MTVNNDISTSEIEKMSFSGDIENVEDTKVEQMTEEEIRAEKRLVRKIDMRIMPMTAIIYLLCYLDRSNIGNAKILNSSTNDDLLQTNNMTTYQYTVALMVFLVAYSLFEAPSNLMMKILSPPKWLGILVFTFGAICAGIGGSKNVAGTTALRFFLGAAEAGVFPGMIFYLSFWYKPEERATRIAGFLCSATLAGAFGGALAFGIGHMNGAGGLEGWRWLFILEGVPSVICGIVIFFFLPQYPESASWLNEEEKKLQLTRMGVNCSHGGEKLSWEDAKHTLKDLRLWIHYITYLALGVGVSSLSLFSPTIVQGLGYENLEAQLFTVPPYACAYVVTFAAAMISDRYKARGLVAGTSFVIGAISFIVQAALPGEAFKTRYAFLVLSTCGVFAGLPALCAWVSDNVRSTTAGSLASGLNIAFTGPGQIIGVWIYRAQDKPLYRLGHGINAGFLALGAILSLGLHLHYRRLNKKLEGTGEARWIS
ncbi:MFS general substrate transporter [Hyaloscypha variabilis F]|uniref:MFS general substrate transporter n=1 Tax=Hyaloscypha variabilis (strain UAMH 11265 / GT02V1 / F) TaxID=1149755 RepID=A0A2J6S458_HYAVF|nr:MFS general substrate transporter [Hyaloscypha variabilis F]